MKKDFIFMKSFFISYNFLLKKNKIKIRKKLKVKLNKKNKNKNTLILLNKGI